MSTVEIALVDMTDKLTPVVNAIVLMRALDPRHLKIDIFGNDTTVIS